jgi:hypothetical protein
MSEASLWNWLRKGVLPRGHYSRIESDASPGFPDVSYCIDGVEGTIELKEARNPKAKYPFKQGGLRPTQLRWIKDRVAAGGRVWILARIGKAVYMVRGIEASEFNGWRTGRFDYCQLFNPRDTRSVTKAVLRSRLTMEL